MSKLRCNGVGGGPFHRPPRGKARGVGWRRPLPCGARWGRPACALHRRLLPCPSHHSGKPIVLLMLSCREAIRAVLLAAEATRAMELPFSTVNGLPAASALR